MNRDDIIRMAREAGWKRVGRNPETGLDLFPVLIGKIERFAALVAAAEREACAKYLDDCGEHEHANYIRSRGEVKP